MALALPTGLTCSGKRNSIRRQAAACAPRRICSAARSRLGAQGPLSTRASVASPPDAEGVKEQRPRVQDDFFSFDEAEGTWDGSCLTTEVPNPVADQACDAAIQTALLDNDHYRHLVPLMCWSRLLDSQQEAPLGVIIGQSMDADQQARADEHVATLEASLLWHLPVMQANASATIWRSLLQDSETQPASTKALIGVILYGLGDIIAQALKHHPFSASELLSIMALGALFEGVCNPWWNAEINRRIIATGSANVARVKSLRFFLNYIVWTPLCCEFYLVYTELLHAPPNLAQVANLPLLVDALLGVPDAEAIELVEELEGFTEGLIDEIQTQGVYMMGASALKFWVPMPLRPLFDKLVEAGAWTIVD